MLKPSFLMKKIKIILDLCDAKVYNIITVRDYLLNMARERR